MFLNNGLISIGVIEYSPNNSLSYFNNYFTNPILGLTIDLFYLTNKNASLNFQFKCFIKYKITIVALLDFPS